MTVKSESPLPEDRQAKLNDWLLFHGAREAWTCKPKGQTIRVTAYVLRGLAICHVVRYQDGGWDVFTAYPGGEVGETLHDAEMRTEMPVAWDGNIKDCGDGTCGDCPRCELLAKGVGR